MEDYLWDKSGKPDPEVERLERLLGEFRHSGKPPRWNRPPNVRRFMAIAAMLLVGIGAAWMAAYWLRSGWKVERLAGSPRVGGGALTGEGLLRLGQTLETDSSSRAELTVGDIGYVQVEPGTRLRLIRSRASERRLSLEHGRISARIFAPPRQFFVNTPSATAVDLGCAYILDVDEAGNGRIHVTLGWVGFESGGLESLIPAGAACVTRRDAGTGTPYFLDASDKLIAAVERFDRTGGDLRIILEEARPRDGMTLWHLLMRTSGSDREAVFQRLAELVPPPGSVTKEGVLALNRTMVEVWWDQFKLGDTNWWKMWKGQWPPRVK